MRKLFLLLIFPLLFACSKEEEPEPEYIEITTYFLGVSEICNEGLPEVFQVKEDVYWGIVNNHKIGECEIVFTIPDIDGKLHEGYYAQNGKEVEHKRVN